ncbi:MAG: hypothetical protein PVF83_19165, partial [Anaerolineales bacterium]
WWLAMFCWWARFLGEMCGLWSGFKIVGCLCGMRTLSRKRLNVWENASGILHVLNENGSAKLINPPHPAAGGGDSPDPLNELRCVFVGCAVVRL